MEITMKMKLQRHFRALTYLNSIDKNKGHLWLK